jgi:CheY-like chemotaxis protein
MDLSLRDGEDGLKITRKIRQDSRFTNVPVIALTAHAFPEDRKRSLEAGCNDYVSKPFQWVHLKSVMEKFL